LCPSYSMPRPHGAASPQQQIVIVSTHFCAVANVAARSDDIRTVVRRSRWSSTISATTLITAFTICYLPYQQRHNITNCAREHTAETNLKELGTSRTHIFLHASYIKTLNNTSYC